MVEERNQARAKRMQQEKIKNIKRASSPISRHTYKMLNKRKAIYIYFILSC